MSATAASRAALAAATARLREEPVDSGLDALGMAAAAIHAMLRPMGRAVGYFRAYQEPSDGRAVGGAPPSGAS